MATISCLNLKAHWRVELASRQHLCWPPQILAADHLMLFDCFQIWSMKCMLLAAVHESPALTAPDVLSAICKGSVSVNTMVRYVSQVQLASFILCILRMFWDAMHHGSADLVSEEAGMQVCNVINYQWHFHNQHAERVDLHPPAWSCSERRSILGVAIFLLELHWGLETWSAPLRNCIGLMTLIWGHLLACLYCCFLPLSGIATAPSE